MSDDLIRRNDAIDAVITYLDLCCMTEARFHKDGKSYNRQIAEELLENVLTAEPQEWWLTENSLDDFRSGFMHGYAQAKHEYESKDGSQHDYEPAEPFKWSDYIKDIEDEPQKCYLRKSCDHYGDKQVCGRCREYNLYSHTKTEPQTERSER